MTDLMKFPLAPLYLIIWLNSCLANFVRIQKEKAKQIEVSDPPQVPEDLRVPAGISTNYGDVLRWEDYRMVECYIVGDDNKLVRNPDLLSAGYLSIPLEITKKFPDASWVYSDFDRLWLVSIALRHDDVFIKTHFGDLPNDCKYTLWTDQYKSPFGQLSVEFPNGKEEYYIPGKDKGDRIRIRYEGSLKPQSHFFVRIKLEHQYLDMYKEKYSQLDDYNNYCVPDSRLPPTWKGKARRGTSGYNGAPMEGESYYEGPKEDEELTKEAIRKYFEGFEDFFQFFTEEENAVLETETKLKKCNLENH